MTRVGAFVATVLVGALVVTTGGPAAAAPPANDDFADAEVIAGLTGSTVGTTVEATYEPGEPVLLLPPEPESVWYRWTAPAAGTVTFDTCGPGLTFDSKIAAYTGVALNALTLQAANDDACSPGSRISFAVTGGTDYWVQLDGFATTTGSFTLAWSLAPSDVTDPTVVITTPPDGAEYEQGEVVAADYSCLDEDGGSGLATCVGTLADGAPIDTSAAGSFDLEVTATDNAGNTTTVTHAYTVVEPPPDDPDDPDDPDRPDGPDAGPVSARPSFAG